MRTYVCFSFFNLFFFSFSHFNYTKQLKLIRLECSHFILHSFFTLLFAIIITVITCEAPNLPPGSYVVGYDYNIHSTIEYHCDAGHKLRGESTLKCMETGDWSGEAPSCEYIDCGPVQPIPYGSFKYLQNTTYIGSDVQYSCINSHRLQGVEKRRCLDGAAWSDETPRYFQYLIIII